MTLPARFTPGPEQYMYTQVNEAAAIQSGLRQQFDFTKDKLGDYAKRRYVDPFLGKTEQQIIANGYLIYKSIESKSITYSWSF